MAGTYYNTPRMTANTALAALSRSQLTQDNSGPFRVYRDTAGKVYHSITHILQETSSEESKQRLANWSRRSDSALVRETAAKRGTAAHNQAEYILKTARRMALHAANNRGSLRTNPSGLERPPKALTTWALKQVTTGALPAVPFAASGYARCLRHWIVQNVTAIHAIEFCVHHPLGFAGTCDALLEIDGKLYITDWKTSERERSDELLLNYKHQLGAYASGLAYLTGIYPEAGAIVVARRSGPPQLRYLTSEELQASSHAFSLRACAHAQALAKAA